MNIPDLVKKSPIVQAFFAVGSISLLLIAITIIRMQSVNDRFSETVGGAEIISRYMIIELALLLITVAGVMFIWFVLLQGRLAGNILFTFKQPETTATEAPSDPLAQPISSGYASNDSMLAQSLEIGKSILKITDLNQLLASAVEIIHAKFDVYHVQIYMTEQSAKTLTLRAGSGRLGEELVRRGHRLTIGAGSINGTAAQRKESILVSDTSQSDLYFANPLLNRTSAEISVPLIVDNQFFGVLNLQSEKVNGINQDHQGAIEAVGDQLAIAIHHAIRIEELEEEQKTITDHAARLTQVGWENWLKSIDGQEELTYVHHTAGNAIVSDSNDKQNMFMASSILVSGNEVGNIHIETDSNRHWGIEDIDLVRAIANQLGQRIENLRLLNESDRFRQEAEEALKQLTRQNWGEFSESLEESGFEFDGNRLTELSESPNGTNGSGAHVDLTVRGEKVGEIGLDTDELDEEDELMLESIVESLSSHIENLRLTEQTQRQVFELSLLNRINSAMTADVNLYDLIEVVGNELREGFAASSTFIAIYNRESNMMEYPYFIIDSKDGLQRIQEEPRVRGTGFSSQVIQSRKPLLISRNPEEMIRAGALVVDMSEMPHSYLGVPIIFGDEVLGVLSLQNRPDRRLFTERDQEVVVSIANGMALTLQNSDLFIKTQQALEVSEQRRQELLAINSVVATTTTAVTVNEAIDRMAEKLMELTGSSVVCTAMIGSSGSNQLEIISERNRTGIDPAQVGSLIALTDNPEIKQVIETQKTYISQTQDENIYGPRLVILPVIGQSGAIGTVKLTKEPNEPGFEESAINLAETIVYQVSTVLENKQLLSDTRSRALREKKVRSITDRIRQGSDQREILRIAKEELSNLVGAKKARSWIGSSDHLRDQLEPNKAQEQVKPKGDG